MREERQAKRESAKAAEAKWVAKVEEQRSKSQSNRHALIRLIRSMPALQEIVLVPWNFDINEYNFEGFDV